MRLKKSFNLYIIFLSLGKMHLADYIKNNLINWPNWVNSILLRCNIFKGVVYGRNYSKFCKYLDVCKAEEKLLFIVNYAIENVPYYRNIYGNNFIKNIIAFENEIKFIDKDEVMSTWEKFIADKINLSKCKIGTTGGTSGKPLKIANMNNRYSIELAFMHRLWKRAGWNYQTRGVIRNHKLPEHISHRINPLTKEIIFDAFKVSPFYVKKIIFILKRYKVNYIHAYPSAAYQFCKISKKIGEDISFLKCFLCASEAVTEEQYHFIKNICGIDIFSWYGHSEKLILAGYENLRSRYFRIEPQYGFFELIDKKGKRITKKGVWGEIVGTTFYNTVMPLIRYRTGDYAVLESDWSSNPNSGCILKEIQGRFDKNLIYRSNDTTISITALNMHGEIYEKIDGLQYIQNKKGELIVNIIKNIKYTNRTEFIMRKHIEDAVGIGEKVIINYVDSLIYQPNGKFLPLISNIDINHKN